MKNILVPFDFSNHSLAALEVANSIAEKQKANISLLYVILDPFTASSGVSRKEYKSSNINKFLEAVKKETFNNLKNTLKYFENKKVKIKPVVTVNASVYKGILRFIDTRKTDLVIMGTHGASGFKTKFLGTNTERIFRMTSKPVMIVSGDAGNTDFKRIVFATDLEQRSVRVLSRVWKFISSYKAKTEILRINTPSDTLRSSYAIGKMRNITKKFKGEFEFVQKDADSPEAGINDYLIKSKADLLIIGVHRKKGFKRLFTDRVSESITRTVKIPVLTIDL